MRAARPRTVSASASNLTAKASDPDADLRDHIRARHVYHLAERRIGPNRIPRHAEQHFEKRFPSAGVPTNHRRDTRRGVAGFVGHAPTPPVLYKNRTHDTSLPCVTPGVCGKPVRDRLVDRPGARRFGKPPCRQAAPNPSTIGRARPNRRDRRAPQIPKGVGWRVGGPSSRSAVQAAGRAGAVSAALRIRNVRWAARL